MSTDAKICVKGGVGVVFFASRVINSFCDMVHRVNIFKTRHFFVSICAVKVREEYMGVLNRWSEKEVKRCVYSLMLPDKN